MPDRSPLPIEVARYMRIYVFHRYTRPVVPSTASDYMYNLNETLLGVIAFGDSLSGMYIYELLERLCHVINPFTVIVEYNAHYILKTLWSWASG